MRLVLLLSVMFMLVSCGGSGGAPASVNSTTNSVVGSVSSAAASREQSSAASVSSHSSSSAASDVCPEGRRIVGYFPSWQGSVVDIQYDYLTHINYAFVMPKSSGALEPIMTGDENELMELVTLAHGHAVKVGIAVGGWNDGDDSAFVALARSAATRTLFVQEIVALVERYQLDGVDMDWEYPSTATQADNFLLLMQELRLALNGLEREQFLSAAVVAQGDWNGQYILNDVFAEVDFLNIMAYDEYGALEHSSMEYAETSLDYWIARGLPRSKTVLGVPFYARPSWVAYREYVASDTANACIDRVAENYYNGLPTIRAKAQLARTNACGVMMWELSQDTVDQTSLLKALWEVSEGSSPSYICPN